MEGEKLFRIVGRDGCGKRFAWEVSRGEFWALTGGDAEAKSLLCAVAAGRAEPPEGWTAECADDFAERARFVSFAAQEEVAGACGFMQGRYCSIVDDAGPGETVGEYLSFNRATGTNPFEAGNPRTKERREFARRRKSVLRALELEGMEERELAALSNGETRRALMAQALLSGAEFLALDDPFAGLDPERRAMLGEALAEFARGGGAVAASVRHADEAPRFAGLKALKAEGGRIAAAAAARGRAGKRWGAAARGPSKGTYGTGSGGRAVFEIRDLKLKYGRRKLFDGFTWRVEEGERWLLRGANGCGKTTLLSLLTGDNPLAYANDVTVFGLKRGPGVELARVRRRIGMVSPEMQAYGGAGAEELLEAALKRKPSLLLLDEPCLNLEEGAAERLKRRVGEWLDAHPRCAAVCVAHRPEDVPPGFGRLVAELGGAMGC